MTLSVDGKHRVIITGHDPQEVTDALEWARDTYADLMGPLGPRGNTPPIDVLGDEPPTCGEHGIPMVKVQGRNGPFWSCHQKNADGSWCSYRPSI